MKAVDELKTEKAAIMNLRRLPMGIKPEPGKSN
jgi:hypothetical protein